MGASDTGPAGGVRVRAPAKVNLYLEVLGHLPGGYHQIRTVMQAVSLYDELAFAPRRDGRVTLSATGPGLPAVEENLVVRAARLLQDRTGCSAGVEITLQKRIPVGSGLAGGSSDCAATLSALNDLWGLGLSLSDLSEMASELGSDVPFFLHGGTALCEGRGERVTPLAVGCTFHYVLVLPHIALATPRVYESAAHRLTNRNGRGSIELERALATGNLDLLGAAFCNALLIPAFRLSPDVAAVGEALARRFPPLGCLGYSLSGSGSGFFGLFGTADLASKAASVLSEEMGMPAFAVESLSARQKECRSPS